MAGFLESLTTNKVKASDCVLSCPLYKITFQDQQRLQEQVDQQIQLCPSNCQSLSSSLSCYQHSFKHNSIEPVPKVAPPGYVYLQLKRNRRVTSPDYVRDIHCATLSLYSCQLRYMLTVYVIVVRVLNFAILRYNVGDHLKILPQNDEGGVEAFMRFYGLDPEAIISTIEPTVQGLILDCHTPVRLSHVCSVHRYSSPEDFTASFYKATVFGVSGSIRQTFQAAAAIHC